jgi:tetratricopeptide (TPR) repeat protein
LRERSGGNPGCALHVLAVLRDRGALQRAHEARILRPELAGNDVPAAVASALERSLRGLSSDVRALLELGAVQEGRCRPSILALCAGRSEMEIIEALHALSGVLRRDGDLYVFRSPLLAVHLGSRLAPERRRALHAEVARALGAAGCEEDAALGTHLYHAGHPQTALPHLERAGRSALARGDAAAALAALDLACAAADLEVGDEVQARRRVDLGVSRAQALQLLAAWPVARDELDRSVMLARAWGLDDAELLVLAALGDIEYAQGRFDAAVERWLEAELVAAKRGDEHGLHELALKVGNVQFERGALAEAAREYERVLEWATQAEDADLEARAAHNVALVESIQGRKERAVQYFNRSLERFRSLGRSDAVARIFHNIGQIYLELGNWAEARNFFGRSMAESERSGQDALLAAACLDSAEASLRLGATAEAAEAVARALATSRERGDAVGVASAYRLQAALAAAAGDTAAAEARLLESIDMLSRLGQALQLGLCWKDLGGVRLQAGRTGAAAAALQEARRLFATLDATQRVAEVEALQARCGEEIPCRP